MTACGRRSAGDVTAHMRRGRQQLWPEANRIAIPGPEHDQAAATSELSAVATATTVVIDHHDGIAARVPFGFPVPGRPQIGREANQCHRPHARAAPDRTTRSDRPRQLGIAGIA